MEIQPLTLDQLVRDRKGRQVLIESDVGNIALDLKNLDSSLRLRVTESGGFVVYQHIDNSDGSYKEHLVLTAKELDARIIDRVRKIMHPSYNYVKELDKLDDIADAKKEYDADQVIGEHGQRIAHALRKDLGIEHDAARTRKAWGKK